MTSAFVLRILPVAWLALVTAPAIAQPAGEALGVPVGTATATPALYRPTLGLPAETPQPTSVQVDYWGMVDDFVANMRAGTVAFNAPERMYLEEDAIVQLLVSLRRSVEELKTQLSEPGQRYGAEVRVARRMRADVVAATSGLQVTALSQADQVVAGTGDTEWRWRVRAVDSGEQRLEVSLTAIVELGGKESSQRVQIYRRTIAVSVTAQHRVKQFFETLRDYWALLAGFSGAIGWLIGRSWTGRGRRPAGFR